MKYDVFISYRREGGYDTAKHLNDLLVRDGYRVSFDIDTLRNGDFDVQLLERIEECDLMRFIENQVPIQFYNVECRNISVDTPKDLEKVREIMAEKLKNN